MRRLNRAVAATVLLFSATLIAAQANSQAEATDRVDLGGLASGQAIIGGGLIFGEPTGLSAKLWFVETGLGLDVAAAWSFQSDRSLYLHAGALYHLALIQTQGGRYIVPAIGAGLTNTYGNRLRIGLRLPVSLSILPFPNLPVELFAELAPGIGLIPETSPEFGAGLGARFYLPL